MFAVVEIDKTFSYEGSFTPYSPYVYDSDIALNCLDGKQEAKSHIRSIFA